MRKKPQKNKYNSNKYITKTLDDYLVIEVVNKDVFGFLGAITTNQPVTGYFAVFDIDGHTRATDIYSKEILEEMVIPDILSKCPGSFYKIFNESDYDRIVNGKS